MRNLVSLLKVFVLLSILSVCVAAQDLGSSNKLFGNGSKTEPKSEKKAPVRTKRAVSKPRPTARTTTKASKSTRTTTSPKKETATGKTAPEGSQKTAVPETPVKYSTFSNAENTASEIKKADNKKSNIEIRPAKPKASVVPSGTAADEMFESSIEEGNRARDDRNYAIAEAAYKRAETVRPKDTRAVYGLGNIYSDQQRWEDAESAYLKALQIDPDSAITNIAISYVLIQPLDVANLADRYEEAEMYAEKATRLAPSSAIAYDQLGVSRELRGLITDETENNYRRAIELNSSFAPAYAHLGRFLRKRGRTKEADAAFQDAIRYASGAATKVIVAEVMQSEQHFENSEELLRKALNDDPRNQAALLLLARSLTVQGKFDEAERTLRRSLDISPANVAAYSQLGSLYTRQGKYSSAEIALTEAQRYVTPLGKRSLVRELEYLGDGYMKAGKSRDAERIYRQAMLIDSEKESLAAKLDRAKRS